MPYGGDLATGLTNLLNEVKCLNLQYSPQPVRSGNYVSEAYLTLK